MCFFVRSPLSTTGLAIDCLIQLLTSKKRLNREELLDLAKDSKITCTAAMQTLNDLLLFDKIESNMLQMEFQETPCKQFLCDCIRPFMRQLSLGKILFSVNIQEELRDYTLKIDQHKLEQVIRNFMGNAVKFTSQNGSINVTASLLSKAPSNPEDEEKTLLRFEVKDSGAGISEANLKKLFGQYVQFNANKLQGGNGSGLGLWSKYFSL